MSEKGREIYKFEMDLKNFFVCTLSNDNIIFAF